MKAINYILIWCALFSNPIFADCESKAALCDQLVKISEKEIELYKINVEKQQTYINIVEKQRDNAYDQLSKSGANMPFYVWLLTGAASGIILIRGLK